jgi:hypothetical protein
MSYLPLSGISTLTGQEISDDGLGGGLSRVGLPVRAGAAAAPRRGALPTAAQSKLLRLLQERIYRFHCPSLRRWRERSPALNSTNRRIRTRMYGGGPARGPRHRSRQANSRSLGKDGPQHLPIEPARSSPLPSSVGYTTATRGYSFWEAQVRARGQAFGVIGPSRSLRHAPIAPARAEAAVGRGFRRPAADFARRTCRRPVASSI